MLSFTRKCVTTFGALFSYEQIFRLRVSCTNKLVAYKSNSHLKYQRRKSIVYLKTKYEPTCIMWREIDSFSFRSFIQKSITWLKLKWAKIILKIGVTFSGDGEIILVGFFLVRCWTRKQYTFQIFKLVSFSNSNYDFLFYSCRCMLLALYIWLWCVTSNKQEMHRMLWFFYWLPTGFL